MVVWKYCLPVDENVLDAILFLLANGDAWWWPQCLLHLLLIASRRTCLYKFHILLQLGIFLVRLQYVPIRLLLLR